MPARKKPTPPSEASVWSLITARLEPLKGFAVTIVAFSAFVGAVVGAWSFIGGPMLVTTVTLKASVDGVKNDVQKQISETKQEVVSKVDAIAHKQDANKIALLQLQQRTLFQQKTTLRTSLSSVEIQLRARPSDPLLLSRKAEIESTLAYIENDANSVQAELRRANQGE